MIRQRRRPRGPEPDHGTAPDGAHGPEASVDPDSDADPGTVAEEPRTTTPRGRRIARLAPWVLVVLATLVAAVSTVGYAQVADLAGREAEREEIERISGEFMLELTNWDATGGMTDTREQLRAFGTERFGGEIDELFGSTEDMAGLSEIGASSSGEVRHNFVQEIGDDTARALVVVDQRVVSDLSDEAEHSRRYAEIDLARVGDDGGDGILGSLRGIVASSPEPSQWRVDDVELLVDAAQPTGGGQPAAPEDQEQGS